MTEMLERAKAKYGRLEKIPDGTLLKAKYPVTNMEYRISSDGQLVLTPAIKLNRNLEFVEYEGACWLKRKPSVDETIGPMIKSLHPVPRNYFVPYMLAHALGWFDRLGPDVFDEEGRLRSWRIWFRNGNPCDMSAANMELVTCSEKQMRIGEKRLGFSYTRVARANGISANTIRSRFLDRGWNLERTAKERRMTRREIGLANCSRLGRKGSRWTKPEGA